MPETPPLFLAIDDNFVLRFSEKAHGSTIACQHARKSGIFQFMDIENTPEPDIPQRETG